MPGNFHESYAAGDVKPPSDRSTGIVFAVVALIVGLFNYSNPTWLSVCAAISGALALVSFLRPSLLRPLNIVWFKFGLLLHKIVNPIVMGILFFVVVTPFGLLARLGHDPLKSKRSGDEKSYWTARDADKATASMRNQF